MDGLLLLNDSDEFSINQFYHYCEDQKKKKFR